MSQTRERFPFVERDTVIVPVWASMMNQPWRIP